MQDVQLCRCEGGKEGGLHTIVWPGISPSSYFTICACVARELRHGLGPQPSHANLNLSGLWHLLIVYRAVDEPHWHFQGNKVHSIYVMQGDCTVYCVYSECGMCGVCVCV